MIDWTTILISAGIGAVFTIIIALWVQKTMKPASERVFEENRESESKWTFKQLERYHESVMNIFNSFEQSFGGLEIKRKKLVTELEFVSADQIEKQEPVSFRDIMRDQSEMEQLSIKNEWDLKRIQQFPLDYGKERNVETLKKYFSNDDFVLPIFSMIKNINDYAEGLVQAELRPHSLKFATKNAKVIVEYLKKHKIYKNNEYAKSFVERWEKAIKEHLE